MTWYRASRQPISNRSVEAQVAGTICRCTWKSTINISLATGVDFRLATLYFESSQYHPQASRNTGLRSLLKPYRDLNHSSDT